ncbi:DUF885 domain-containing protein [Ferruginibacter sp.]|uniref:DUF885 domain-containing protein n=1 Tax=Ferruginibacter sp. TaxID=1940288 RepID=UPI0019BF9039|nr:DUF885 domain-containing protein [Ferruginibacter sp.]MBC7629254.1 DUF885 domain-containing protein [Ferruginibacter sp.]
MRHHLFSITICSLLFFCCNHHPSATNAATNSSDINFNDLQTRFLDAYWKENPSAAIAAGYGKYYERLVIPDSAAFAATVAFSKAWLDTLQHVGYNQLSDDNKINYAIVQNQLQSAIWYTDTFKIQQWNPSDYNLGGECYNILTQNYAPLTQRLIILGNHLKHADDYYRAALNILNKPTKEYTALAIQQNKGSLDLFGKDLTDSIKKASLSQTEKDTLQQHIELTTKAIKNYIAALEGLMADKKYSFRDFRIGKELFRQKFKYDLVTDYEPGEIFAKASAAKKYYHKEMFSIATSLWPKYCKGIVKPADTLMLIKNVLDKMALHNADPKKVVTVATQLVQQLQQFIIRKNLFNYDTSYPLKVRIMPAFMGGVALANAEFTPPYLKSGITYYNVSDVSAMPAAEAESTLREYNDFSLQFLSMHEAMPGHCLQGVYSNKQSGGSMVKAVFQNGAMIEGWAVYCEQMMMENGWGNGAPELWLTLYKWRLRELGNVLVDYGLQCLHYSEKDVTNLLKKETFQEDAQISEKYHRATVSQVQLCSYFTGAEDILSLRNAFKIKKGNSYQLKNFHEQFLSYGSSPVKYIREMMLK